MNDYDIEYDINGDNFEYAQELCRHSENYYGQDNTTRAYEEAVDAHLEAQFEDDFECDS